MSNEIKQLKELSGSKFEIVDGEPDIRKWDVQTNQGLKIGKVDDLLFDEESRRVRYIVVDIDDNDTEAKEDRKVLVPIGLATLHKNNNEVLLPNVSVNQIASLPDYEKGNLNGASERIIRNILEGTPNTAVAASAADMGTNESIDFYNHEHFDENKLYESRHADTDQTIPVIKENISIGKRIVQTGGVAIHTNIVEEPVQETILLREEHVRIERKPVNIPVTDADVAKFKESTIELTESAEVPVVLKEARVVEEISLKKEVDERQETIRDSVRETEVEVDELDKNFLKKDDSL